MARPPNKFQPDPRYTASVKGTILFTVVYLTVIVIWFVICFALGARPVAELVYVAGMPAWVFWGLIVWPLATIFIFWLLLWYGPPYKDIPLDESGDDGGELP